MSFQLLVVLTGILAIAVVVALITVGWERLLKLRWRRNKKETVLLPQVVQRPAPSVEELKVLARSGRKLEAIRLIRNSTGQSITEARSAVEQLGLRGPQPMRKQGLILREVRDTDIEWQIRTGHLLNAIQLYREKNGVGLQEARTAVERWRDRLRAS